MYTLIMNKTITQFDLDAEQEGQANIRYKKQWIGVARQKTKYAPADIVPTRKACRSRNSRQINLQTIRIRERLENPALYKKQKHKSILEKNTMTMVKRTIDKKAVELTPTENFIYQTGYRVDMIGDQLKRLGGQRGTNYEYTKEHVAAIEEKLLALVTTAIESLNLPAGKKAKSSGFAAELKKV